MEYQREDAPFGTEPLEPLIQRFSPWFTALSPVDQNAAFLMTSGLADAMAREKSRYSPDPGFFDRYVSGSHGPAVTRHEQTYGSYRAHASHLQPPLTPRELGAIGWQLFAEPIHRAPHEDPDETTRMRP
jgi:hypothetical protein